MTIHMKHMYVGVYWQLSVQLSMSYDVNVLNTREIGGGGDTRVCINFFYHLCSPFSVIWLKALGKPPSPTFSSWEGSSSFFSANHWPSQPLRWMRLATIYIKITSMLSLRLDNFEFFQLDSNFLPCFSQFCQDFITVIFMPFRKHQFAVKISKKFASSGRSMSLCFFILGKKRKYLGLLGWVSKEFMGNLFPQVRT